MKDELNNWQNIGKARVFARKNVPKKYLSVYMTIVDFSIGFGNNSTDHKSVEWFSKEIGISRNTFIKHIKELENGGFIKTNTPKIFLKDGGKVPNSYSVCYTVGKHSMGYINTKQEVKTKTTRDESSDNEFSVVGLI